MHKSKSKITALLLTVLFLSISIIGQAQAATISEVSSDTLMGETVVITPFWENASDVVNGLSFSNGEAQCTVFIYGKSGTTSISATITLEQKTSSGWSAVKTWSGSVQGNYLTFSGKYSVSKGNTYRLSVSSTVIRNGVSESVSSISIEKTS